MPKDKMMMTLTMSFARANQIPNQTSRIGFSVAQTCDRGKRRFLHFCFCTSQKEARSLCGRTRSSGSISQYFCNHTSIVQQKGKGSSHERFRAVPGRLRDKGSSQERDSFKFLIVRIKSTRYPLDLLQAQSTVRFFPLFLLFFPFK